MHGVLLIYLRGMSKIKIGLIGAGYMGKIHLEILREIEAFEVIGFYDTDAETSLKVAAEYGLHAYDSAEALIKDADALDIVTPTQFHYEYASRTIKKSKHVFIEKPLCTTTRESRSLVNLTQEADVRVQVGHVERFNPAFLAAKEYINDPLYIESHRLAVPNERGVDISVVLDLMIHDIDIVLSLVKSNIKKISSNSLAIISEKPDFANARIEFDNGCVANLTASKISTKNTRKTQIFQKDAYISIDFLNKSAEITRSNGLITSVTPELLTEPIKILGINAIKTELESFAQAIMNNSDALVSIDDGHRAMEVAYKVIERLIPLPQ